MENKKKSLLDEAIIDFKEIKEAATKNAKTKLAEEFPEKFQSLLKEELKNNKESVNETNKSDELKDSNMKKVEKVKEVKKEEEKIDETKKVAETKKVDEKEKKDEIVIDDKTKPKAKVADTAKADKSKKIEKTPLKEELENIDMRNQGSQDVENAFNEAKDGDQFEISLEDIEKELQEMEEMSNETNPEEMSTEVPAQEELPKEETPEEEIPESGYEELKKIYDEIGQIISGMEKESSPESNGEELDKNVDNIPDSPEAEQTPEFPEKEVDENLGVRLSVNKKAGAEVQPRPEYGAEFKKAKLRYALQSESLKKRLNALLNENKKVVKSLNETKKQATNLSEMVEKYKQGLDKYRTQLKEMAIFNTNLSHTNNLLMNEELALTSADKTKIVNEFKQVNTITESKAKYSQLVSEFKAPKKSITENVENKINNTSVQNSSKQKLEEVTEKIAYQDNDHLNKIKHMINELEKRGKKNNL